MYVCVCVCMYVCMYVCVVPRHSQRSDPLTVSSPVRKGWRDRFKIVTGVTVPSRRRRSIHPSINRSPTDVFWNVFSPLKIEPAVSTLFRSTTSRVQFVASWLTTSTTTSFYHFVVVAVAAVFLARYCLALRLKIGTNQNVQRQSTFLHRGLLQSDGCLETRQ